MNISVIGTGYVGLVLGVCLADVGHQVICVDNDLQKLELLRSGKIPIYELGLAGHLASACKKDNIRFTAELSEALEAPDVLFLCLPTPPGKGGQADRSILSGVVEALAPQLKHSTVVVTKSTVPVGTTQQVQAIFDQKCQVPVSVVSNPEFLREGEAVKDFLHPTRIIVGTEDPEAAELMRRVYAPILGRKGKFLVMDSRSAELTKYTANAFLAAKISFINEIAQLSEQLGADISAIYEGIGLDPRIGTQYLRAGLGYGGSCLPKDVKALCHTAQDHGIQMKVLRAVDQVNEFQATAFLQKLFEYFSSLEDKCIAVWGLSFKPGTDDVREAPSLPIVQQLLKKGAKVKAYDPMAMSNFPKALKVPTDSIEYPHSALHSLQGADALLICTDWPEFRIHPPSDFLSHMKHPAIFDGRNIYRTETFENTEVSYFSIGRKSITPKG